MYDLEYMKSQRRIIRTDLKRYLITFRDDIVADFNIELPTKEEIKLMSKTEFAEWTLNNYSKFAMKEEIDLELIELLESFMCLENNIENLESLKNNLL